MNNKLLSVSILFAFVALSIVSVSTTGQAAMMDQTREFTVSVGSYTDSYESGDFEGTGNSISFGYLHGLPVLKQAPGKILAEGSLTYANPSEDFSGVTWDGTAYDLSGLGVYRKSFGPEKKLSGSLKLGFNYGSRDYEQDSSSLLPSSADGSGIGLAYGIDLGYDFTEKHGAQIEYLVKSNPDLEDSTGGTTSADQTTEISVGYVMSF